MNRLGFRDVAILASATLITRFAFRSHYLYDIDSVNFALALRRFDPTVHQPHPPGYFLYVCLGRLADLIFHDANAAFVAISILSSCAAVAMIYVLADNWFGRSAALFAGLIFIFSPLAWFHGTVALTYIVEAFFSAVTGYLCWRFQSGASRWLVAAAISLGIAAGFRPSTLLMLGPLFLYSLRNARVKQASAGIGALVVTLLGWLIPMVSQSGGKAYLSALFSLWIAVPAKGMVFNSSLWNSFARAWVIVAIYFLCFGCAAVLLFLGRRVDSGVERRKIRFTQVWMAPGLLFFTFVYLKFVNSGYLLALAPPVCVWMGLWAASWYASSRRSRALKVAVVAVCAVANALIFLRAPVYCSYGAVRRFEAELESIVRVLPQIVSPKDTIIVGFDSHFLGYRQAGYYLPDYLTVQFPKVQLASGKRAFCMRDRDTMLESALPLSGFQHFILFPLPLGDSEYQGYMAQLRARFPAGALRVVTSEGHEFAIGPIGKLPVLFPAENDSQPAHSMKE